MCFALRGSGIVRGITSRIFLPDARLRGHDDRGLYLTVNRYGRSKPPFSGLCLRMNRGKSQGMALLANKRLFDIF